MDTALRLGATWVDFMLVAVFFAFVLGIGWAAKRGVSSSIDFFLSGRGLPAWITGLAFISANLGAVEIIGMSANGVEYGVQTMHYFWIGAVPAMIFLGIVMMPFYYGSKVRSVPEFMLKRFGPAAHLVNAISFAVAQLLIAGVNLFLLATVVEALLGWPLWATLVVAALIVLAYITLGGLSAAIYNEVLQFFVIIAALLPLTIIGLRHVGGWSGLKEAIGDPSHFSAWPGQDLSGFDNPVWSVIGIVFGLGFVLSFGYWTTNFVEVQRAMASRLPRVRAENADHWRVPEDVRTVHRDRARHDRQRLGFPDHGGRGEPERRGALPHARLAAERFARRGHCGSARRVHGGYGREHFLVQHGVLLRPVADVPDQGPRG